MRITIERTRRKQEYQDHPTKTPLKRVGTLLTRSLLIILGLGILLLLAWLELSPWQGTIPHMLVLFSGHIAVALLSVGVISFFLDLPHYRIYFEERLGDIAIKQEFLSRLDKDQLLTLQANVLKAYFKKDNIDRDGSFFEFYRVQLQDLLSKPYREDYRIFLRVELDAATNEMIVDETLTYTCREVGGFIQEHVAWIATGDRAKYKIEKLNMALTIPRDCHVLEDVRSALRDHGLESYLCNHVFTLEDVHARPYSIVSNDLLGPTKQEGYKMSLRDFSRVDRLDIEIQSRYRQPADATLIVKQYFPSRRVQAILRYPAQMQLDVVQFGYDDARSAVTYSNGECRVTFNDWMLPECGLAFDLTDQSQIVNARTKVARGGPQATSLDEQADANQLPQIVTGG